MKLKYKVLTFFITVVTFIAILQVSQLGFAEFFPSGGQGSP